MIIKKRKFRCGVVGNISSFHLEAPGSIPGIGNSSLFFLFFPHKIPLLANEKKEGNIFTHY